MRPFTLTDFSGGISEQFPADAFTGDSVAKAEGFILDGTAQVRTQWDCEAVGSLSLTGVRGFAGKFENYLVGVDASGDVWWTRETVISWTKVTGTTAGLPLPNTAYRFLCEVPRGAATYTSEDELSSTDSGGTTTVSTTATSDVVLWAGNGLLVNCVSSDPATAHRDAFVLYESSAGVLDFELYSNQAGDADQRFPRMQNHPQIGGQQIPSNERIVPHANVGVMWGDRLFLADVFWYGSDGNTKTTTNETLDADGQVVSSSVTYTYTSMNPLDSAGFTGANGTYTYTAGRRYKNAIWVSEPGQPYTYDNLSLDLPASEDAAIVDLEVTDLGLLVYTTTAAGEDGVILLRGTPGSYVVNRLRNLSAPRRVSDSYKPVGTYWQASGAFCFIDRLGGIWATQGDEVFRLDGPASVDNRTGADEDDHLCAIGQYLFAAHSDRLLCMRAFGDTAGWTELVTPGKGSAIQSMTEAGENLYFLQGGSLYRFVCSGGSYGAMPVGSVTDEFVFGTATVAVPTADGADFGRSQWHRVGVTLSGDGVASELVSVSSKAGPVLDAGVDSYTVAVDPSEVVVGSRAQRVVPAGIGFVHEGSVEFSVRGDVIVESVTVWSSPGKRGW